VDDSTTQDGKNLISFNKNEMFPQFFNFTDSMNFFQLCLFFIACFLIYIIIGILTINGVWSFKDRAKFNLVTNGFSAVLPLIFSVIVGSIIVTAWKYQNDADYQATREANDVGDIYVMVFDLNYDAPRIRHLMHEYANNVINIEWPLMRKSIKPTSGWSYLVEMQYIISNFKPVDLKDKILLNRIQNVFSDLLDARRKRIAASLNNIPFVIYILLFFICAFIIFFNFFLGIHPWTQGILLTCLSIPIALCIVVIIALDCPFRTQIRIDPDEMIRVVELMKRGKKKNFLKNQ
jgi:Protein of unknown function (DUF4239)